MIIKMNSEVCSICKKAEYHCECYAGCDKNIQWCEKHEEYHYGICDFCEAEIVPDGLQQLINYIGTIKEPQGDLLKKCPDPVVEAVVAKLRSRSEVGVKKYGTTLDGNNSSVYDWLNHLQEELMDAVNYIEKLKQTLYKEQK